MGLYGGSLAVECIIGWAFEDAVGEGVGVFEGWCCFWGGC